MKAQEYLPSPGLFITALRTIIFPFYVSRNMTSTMLAITAPKYTKPDGYERTEVAKLAVAQPTDVLIRVHAASINPIDVKKAEGLMKMAVHDTYVTRHFGGLGWNNH